LQGNLLIAHFEKALYSAKATGPRTAKIASNTQKAAGGRPTCTNKQTMALQQKSAILRERVFVGALFSNILLLR
jgi:hypothetical protein